MIEVQWIRSLVKNFFTNKKQICLALFSAEYKKICSSPLLEKFFVLVCSLKLVVINACMKQWGALSLPA